MKKTTPHSLRTRKRFGPHILRCSAIGLLFLFLLPMVARTVEAADGDLDTTFGSGGIVNADIFFNAVKIQSDGKIVAAGGAMFNFAVARYNPNGSPDPTFGSGGKVITSFSTAESVQDLLIQSDGKIVAVGGLGNLARYNSDGSLDATFGMGGKAKADITTYAIALQSNGKIVVAGSVTNTPDDTDFALERFNADGALDTTFGSNGKVITAFSSSYDAALDVVIQNDGKIVAVGQSNNLGSFALARYNSNGSLDLTFGTGGKVQNSFSPFLNVGQAGALQKDGKILVTGVISNLNTEYDFALVRYNTDGSLDQNFGSGGAVATDFFNGLDLGNDVVTQSDGKIIVVGQAKNSNQFDASYHFGLVRYNSNGSLDLTFGSGGKVYTIVSTEDRAAKVALQSDGKIVVAGNTGVTNFSGALVRYNNQIFDSCLQDDSNANLLKFNSLTGDYLFTTCNGLTIGGTGTLTRNGSSVTLQHYASDRRVIARLDASTNRGTASVQIFSQGMTFTITDRNTANNLCVCSTR